MRENLLRRILILSLVVAIAFSFFAFSYVGVPEAEKNKVKLAKNAIVDNDTWIDINNVRMVTSNRGSISWDIVTGNAGLEYPRGTGKLAIFAAGVWLYGMVENDLRAAIAAYGFEFFPGPVTSAAGTTPTTWADGSDPMWQVLKVTKGDGPENPDYTLWKQMAAYGAPVDAGGDPLITGDQMIWTIFNDADPSIHNGVGNSRPLNIEVRESIFAFDKSDPLGNTVFVELEFQNKGHENITDFYASFWSDPDLGDSFNDVVGCDIERSMGYVYNADNDDGVYVGEGAAVGYDFFQGVKDPDGNILGMTSFNKYINGTDPGTAEEAYFYAQGLNAAGMDLIDPSTGAVTKYYCNGDPVTNKGWVDSAPADRRLMCNSGPTNFAPGDVNTVVVALICGSGTDRLNAITTIRYNDKFAQRAFDIDFDIPPDPDPPAVTIVTLPSSYFVTWQDNAEDFNSFGYEFEGYNVYVTSKSSTTSKADWRNIDIYDKINGIKDIKDEKPDPVTGEPLIQIVQYGTDSGLKRWYKMDIDKIDGGPLIAEKEYYFGVSAYAYNPIGVPKILESNIVQQYITPKPALPGNDFSGVEGGTPTVATHSAGIGVGDVYVTVVNPRAVTGNSYKVVFNDDAGDYSWSLMSGSTVKIDHNTNFEGDWNSPITDGLVVRVSGSMDAPTKWTNTGDRRDFVVEGSLADTRVDPADETSDYVIPNPLRFYFRGFNTAFDNNSGMAAPAILGHDIKVIVKGYGLGQIATAIDGHENVIGNHVIPFEFWDMEADGGAMQINACHWDRDANGEFNAYVGGAYDRIILVNSPYDPNGTHTPASPNATWYFSLYEDEGVPTDPNWDDDLYYFTPGQESIMKFGNPLGGGVDEFSFTTQAPIMNDAVVAKDIFMNKIRIVPNPYFGFAKYERTRFQRVMLFTNLPEQVTIRIFDLGGTLIRTIEKDSQDPTYRWDMLTDYQLPLGSGVYIAHIDHATYGAKILKFAVFSEQETLETY